VRPDRLELFLPLPGEPVVVIIFGLLFIQTSRSSTPHNRLPEIDVLISKPIYFPQPDSLVLRGQVRVTIEERLDKDQDYAKLLIHTLLSTKFCEEPKNHD